LPQITLGLDEASDQELLGLVAQRRFDAFEELYRRHAAAVNAVARRLSPDSEVAMEVTHVAFMRLWDHAGLLDRESRLRAWLTTVAHNAAWDRRRRKSFATIQLVEARIRLGMQRLRALMTPAAGEST
jgi:DNA-directed RNA polymerase specialized sigma24 family protein